MRGRRRGGGRVGGLRGIAVSGEDRPVRRGRDCWRARRGWWGGGRAREPWSGVAVAAAQCPPSGGAEAGGDGRPRDACGVVGWEGRPVRWALRLSAAGHDLLAYAGVRPAPTPCGPGPGERLVELAPSQVAALLRVRGPGRAVDVAACAGAFRAGPYRRVNAGRRAKHGRRDAQSRGSPGPGPDSRAPVRASVDVRRPPSRLGPPCRPPAR
ncbi:DUF6417 family protein [Streptomyces sp. NBC_00289]